MTGVSGVTYQPYLYEQQGMTAPPQIYQSKDGALYGYDAQSDSFVSQTGNKCTDGKDDGKIGFWGALGHTIKGIGKTICNGVKGMFTGKDGKFSLGKTLLSIGTAALCIAVPAVGVGLCAVGVVSGGIQVGKGVYKAATAKTDAEAKDAWEDIGGGGFTVAASVVGAKAGIKGMKTAAAKTSAGSALDALKGTKFTLKTARSYGEAFLQDGWRSGKYNLGQIRNTASGLYHMAGRDYNKAKMSRFNTNTNDSVKFLEMQEAQKPYMERFNNHINKLSELDSRSLQNANNILTGLRESGNTVGNAVRHPFQTAGNAIHSDGAQNAIQALRHPINTMRGIPQNLSSGARAVWQAIHTTNASYAELVNQYGFANVAEVLKFAGGVELGSQAI